MFTLSESVEIVPALLIVVEFTFVIFPVVALMFVMFPVVALTFVEFVVVEFTVPMFAARALSESVRIVPVFVIVRVFSESLVIAPLFVILFDVKFVTDVACRLVLPVARSLFVITESVAFSVCVVILFAPK